MTEKKLKTDVAQGATEVQPINGKGVVDPINTKSESLKPSSLHPIDSLNKYTLYNIVSLKLSGYNFCWLKVNREPASKQIRKMKESIKSTGGVVMPLTVIQASKIPSEFEMVDEEGQSINDESTNLNKTLVILDGQHRYKAYCELCEEGITTYPAYVMLPLIEPEGLEMLLQEINTSVNPWDGIDWLTSLTVTAKSKGFPVDAIEFVKELSTNPDISDSAAWLWAKGEIISKGKIVGKLKKSDLEAIKTISSDKFIGKRKELFDVTKLKLGGKLVGLKSVPSLFNTYEEDLVNKSIPRPITWDKIIEFTKNISIDTVKILQGIKKNDKSTKDQQISEILNSEWEKYLTNIPDSNH